MNGQSPMATVQVVINSTNGMTMGVEPLMVDEDMTFGQAQRTLVSRQTCGKTPNYVRYRLVLQFFDKIRLHRLDYEPHPSIKVLEEAYRLQAACKYSGRMVLALVETYPESFDYKWDISVGKSSRLFWDEYENGTVVPTYVSKAAGGSGTGVVPDLKPLSLGEWLNNSLMTAAVKQGELQIYEHFADKWHPVYVVLTDERLWYFSIASPHQPASFVDLTPDIAIAICPDNPYAFMVFTTDVEKNKLVSEATYKEFSFKCVSKNSASEWCESIRRREVVCSSADMMSELDDEIEMFECDRFLNEDLDKICENLHFEGMIKNHSLRPLFEKYLEDRNCDEHFKFWQYSEDFRRGHPKATYPFAFKSATIAVPGMPGSGGKNSGSARHWGGLLYGAFLEDRAPQQVGECSSEERMRIKDNVLQEPPSTTFGAVQMNCFRLLKFTEYPSFVSNKLYLRHAQMAYLPYAYEQRRLGGRGCWTDDAMPPSAPSSEAKDTGLRRAGVPPPVQKKEMSKLNTSIAPAVGSNHDGEGDETNAMLPEVMDELACPWRRGILRAGQSAQAGSSMRGKNASKGNLMAFEHWMGDDWWDYVDVRVWASYMTNDNHEQSLREKILPKWMPLDVAGTKATLLKMRSDAREGREKLYEVGRNVAALREAGKLPPPSDPTPTLPSLKSIFNRGDVSDGSRSSASGTFDLGLARRRDDDMEDVRREHLRIRVPTRVGREESVEGEGSGLVGRDSRNGVWVYGEEEVRESALRRRRCDPLAQLPFGIQGLLIFASAAKSITLKPAMDLKGTNDSSHTSHGGGSNRLDTFLKAKEKDAGMATWSVVLTMLHGQGRLHIYDPTRPTGASFVVLCRHVAGVRPATEHVKGADRPSPAGFQLFVNGQQRGMNPGGNYDKLCIVPQGVSDLDSMRLTVEWIRHLHVYCTGAPPSGTSRQHRMYTMAHQASAASVGILKYGLLDKEGEHNKSFRQRLFVLYTNAVMGYYIPKTLTNQGSIDLSNHKDLLWVKDTRTKLRLSSMLGSTMKMNQDVHFVIIDQAGRKWRLSSKDEHGAKEWTNTILHVCSEVHDLGAPVYCDDDMGGADPMLDSVPSHYPRWTINAMEPEDRSAISVRGRGANRG